MLRPIRHYENAYWVSDQGEVYSVKRKMFLRPRNVDRYFTVALWMNNKQKNFYIHDLVAQAFLGPKPSGYEVHHGKGGKSDNRVTNLSYVTPEKNRLLQLEMGQTQSGVKHWNAKLTDKKVRQLFELRKTGLTQKMIGTKLGISQSHVAKILNRHKWRDLAVRGIF